MTKEQRQRVEKYREIVENTTKKPVSGPPSFTSSSGKKVKKVQEQKSLEHSQKK